MLGAADDGMARMMEAMLLDMPLRSLGMLSGGKLPPNFAEMLIAALNGNIFSRAIATIRLMLGMAGAGRKQAGKTRK